MRFSSVTTQVMRGAFRAPLGKTEHREASVSHLNSSLSFVSLLPSFTRSDTFLAHARRHQQWLPPQRASGGWCKSGRKCGTAVWERGHGQQQPAWSWLGRKHRGAEGPHAPPGPSVHLSVLSGLNSATRCSPAGYSHTGQLRKFPENMNLLIIGPVWFDIFPKRMDE